MKKRLILYWLLVISLIVCFIGIAYAMQCPAGTHTFEGGTEASDRVYCIPDVGASGPVGTPAGTPSTTLPTSGTYDELYAAWERYCRWGTAGITDAQCEQLQDAMGRAYDSENPPAETPEETPETTPAETPQEASEETTGWDEYYKGMTLEQLEEEKQKNEGEQSQCLDEMSACFSRCESSDTCTKRCLNDLSACDDPCWTTRDTCFRNCPYCEECNTNQEACTAACSDTYDTCCDDCYAASESCGDSCGDCRSFADKADAIGRAIAQKEGERYAKPPEEIPETPKIPEAPDTPEIGIGEDTNEVQDLDSLLDDAKQRFENAQDASQLNLMLLNALSSVNTGKMTDGQLEEYIRGMQPMILNALLNMRDPIDAMKATWYMGALNKAIETEKQRGNKEALSQLQKDYYGMVEAAAAAFEGQQIKSGTLGREELAGLAAMAKGMKLAIKEYKESGEQEKAAKAQDTISKIKASLDSNKEESQFIAKEMLDTETTAAFNLQNDIGDFTARQVAANQEEYGAKIDKATEAYIKMLESRDKMFQSKESDEIAQLQKDIHDYKIEAIGQFQSILESDEYDSRANFALGTIYRKDGDSETARVLYGRALLGLKGTKDFDKMSAGIKNEALRHQVLADLGVTVQPASSTSLFMKRLGNEGSGLVSNVGTKMQGLYRDAELWGRSMAWSGKIEPSRDKIGEVVFSASEEKTREAAYGQ